MSLDEFIPKKVIVSDRKGQSSPDHAGSHEKSPSDSLDHILIQPVNAENEKELYQNYYDSIYPKLKGKVMTFEQLAEKAGLRMRLLSFPASTMSQ